MKTIIKVLENNGIVLQCYRHTFYGFNPFAHHPSFKNTPITDIIIPELKNFPSWKLVESKRHEDVVYLYKGYDPIMACYVENVITSPAHLNDLVSSNRNGLHDNLLNFSFGIYLVSDQELERAEQILCNHFHVNERMEEEKRKKEEYETARKKELEELRKDPPAPKIPLIKLKDGTERKFDLFLQENDLKADIEFRDGRKFYSGGEKVLLENADAETIAYFRNLGENQKDRIDVSEDEKIQILLKQKSL